MVLKNTGKNTLKRLAVSLIAAMIALYLAVYFFSTPRLGPHYDFLMRLRPYLKPAHLLDSLFAPSKEQKKGVAENNSVDSGILLIETGGNNTGENVIAASTVYVLLMTLAEMNAESLLIETPVLGVSSGHSLSEAELVYRFDEEFNLVESNVKNLFDGIRFG
jgi:hypothetical protein